MKYDIDYFIKKFEAIPEELWIIRQYKDAQGRACAFGHCGATAVHECTPEEHALMLLTRSEMSIAEVNDGGDSRFRQPTPKQRILAALHHLKAQTT